MIKITDIEKIETPEWALNDSTHSECSAQFYKITISDGEESFEFEADVRKSENGIQVDWDDQGQDYLISYKCNELALSTLRSFLVDIYTSQVLQLPIELKQTAEPEKRIKKRTVIVLIILSSILVDYTYHRIFYSKTDARVVFSETETVGYGSSRFGSYPILETTIKVRYTTEDGITYISKPLISPDDVIRGGDMVSIKYKKSNPKKCFLD